MKCSSTVGGVFPRERLGGETGQIKARICYDGECKSYEGRLGNVGARPAALDVWQVTNGVLVTMDLPVGDYDETTLHQVIAELQVEDNDPVRIKRAVALKPFQANGRACAATCWSARLRPNEF